MNAGSPQGRLCGVKQEFSHVCVVPEDGRRHRESSGEARLDLGAEAGELTGEKRGKGRRKSLCEGRKAM